MGGASVRGYSNDGTLLYLATGDSGKIRAYHTSDWTKAGEVSLDGSIADAGGKAVVAQGSFAATVTVSPGGKTLYALDQGNWRIVVLDAATLKRIAESLAEAERYVDAASYAREALRAGPTLKWTGYTAWLTFRALLEGVSGRVTDGGFRDPK